MALLHSIRFRLPFSGPPERRSEAEIENDLDDEFAFHLEMKTLDLIEEGHSSPDARALAQVQFGNIERIKSQCRRIALEERIVLQRINFIMMGVVLVLVIIVGVQVFMTQRYNTLALQDITSQLAQMRTEAAARNQPLEFAPAEPEEPAAPGSARVLIGGDVANPGWHEISLTTGTTIRQMLERLNVQPDQWVRYRRAGAESSSPVLAAD